MVFFRLTFNMLELYITFCDYTIFLVSDYHIYAKLHRQITDILTPWGAYLRTNLLNQWCFFLMNNQYSSIWILFCCDYSRFQWSNWLIFIKIRIFHLKHPIWPPGCLHMKLPLEVIVLFLKNNWYTLILTWLLILFLQISGSN